MQVDKIVVGSLQTNCFLVWDEEKHAAVIDPGDQFPVIDQAIQKHGLLPKAVLLTHGHFDHIGAVNPLVKDYGVKVYAHEAEKELLTI